MNEKIIKLDYIDDNSHWHLIGGYENYKKIRRIKNINKKKGNCFFARGVKLKLVNFIYRSVKKLSLSGCDFIFSKGAVKYKNIASNNYCSMSKLPWVNAISIIIPYRLSYDNMVDVDFEGQKRSLRKMELLILGTLLKIRFPKKSNSWYTKKAINVLLNGWVVLDELKKNKKNEN